jgi:hypothetical protein
MKNKIIFIGTLLASNLSFGMPANNLEAADTAVAVAGTVGVRTEHNQPTVLQSVHGVTIYNTTAGFKDFQWTLSLCPENMQCVVEKGHLGLATGQHWGKTFYLQTTVVYPRRGTKALTAKTEITGGASGVAYDTKYVEVW